MKLRRTPSPHGSHGSITVHSQGGLGNQLFIYAVGLAAAHHSGLSLRVDASWHTRNAERPFRLKELGLPGDYFELPEGATHSRVRRRLMGPPYRCSYRESSPRFDDAVLGLSEGSCLHGYFQAYQYVEHAANELRGSLSNTRARLRESPAYRQEMSLLQEPGTIALHVRRGDYLAKESIDFHGLAERDYYRRAVELLRRMGMNGPLVLFSDDPERAMCEMKDLGDVVLPSRPQSLGAVEEMFLMSESAALVTANSSFSWWSAWIGSDTQRPVVCPRPWFADSSIDGRDIFMPGWITLQR